MVSLCINYLWAIVIVGLFEGEKGSKNRAIKSKIISNYIFRRIGYLKGYPIFCFLKEIMIDKDYNYREYANQLKRL